MESSRKRKQGLSDPTRGAQVCSNSQVAVAYRELASAHGLPGGFTNRMLMEPAQAVVGIGDLDMRPGRENQSDYQVVCSSGWCDQLNAPVHEAK